MSDPKDRSSLFGPPKRTPPRPKQGMSRGLLITIVGSSVVVILAAIAAAVVLLWGAATARENTVPELLGEDTQIYGTITPALSDVANIARIQGAYPDLFVEQNPEAADEQLERVGLRFQEDIQPWLGAEVSFAVSNLDDLFALSGSMQPPDPETVSENIDIMLLAASRNDTAAQEFINKLVAEAANDGAQTSEIPHNNVTIYESSETDEFPHMFLALVKGYVVAANKSEPIEAMIDRDPAGGNTLADNPRYQRLRASQPQDAIGSIYIDVAAMSEQMAEAAEDAFNENEIAPEAREQFTRQLEDFEAFEAMGLSISIKGEGVAFDSTATTNPDDFSDETMALIDESAQPMDASRLDRISDEAIAFMTFKIPASFKEQFLLGFNAQPGADESRAQLERSLGFDLERDFLDWFAGDASLVFLPGDRMGDVTLPASSYFAINTTNRDAAESGMREIARALEQFAGFSFQPETIANSEWQVIADPSSGQTMAGYGFAEDDLVIAFGNTAIAAATTGGDAPITSDPTFTTVTSYLADPNGGMVYFDAGKTFDLIDSLGVGTPSPEAEEVRENIEPIKALGMAAEPGISEDGVIRSRMFVYISGSGE